MSGNLKYLSAEDLLSTKEYTLSEQRRHVEMLKDTCEGSTNWQRHTGKVGGLKEKLRWIEFYLEQINSGIPNAPNRRTFIKIKSFPVRTGENVCTYREALIEVNPDGSYRIAKIHGESLGVVDDNNTIQTFEKKEIVRQHLLGK